MFERLNFDREHACVCSAASLSAHFSDRSNSNLSSRDGISGKLALRRLPIVR
jgi:hypothetical protein